MKRLLWLYPRPWRERYGTEFGALLDELGVTPALLADVARGAALAHVDQLTKRGEPVIRTILVLLVLATIAVSGFGVFSAVWVDTDSSPVRAFAATSFAVPVAIGVLTLVTLVAVRPAAGHRLAQLTAVAGIALAAIAVVGGIGVLVVGQATGDYEWGIATANGALVVQGVLTALYFSGRLGGEMAASS